MPNNLSFDDNSDQDLDVISAYDLLISDLDVADLDWEEIGERSFIAKRRGLVIAQVAAMEEVLDDFIMYVVDPPDVAAYLQRLASWSIGQRVKGFKEALCDAGVWDDEAAELVAALRAVVDRRNLLVHGAIYCRPIQRLPIKEWHAGMEFEWILHDRRTGVRERLSMVGLREDLGEAAHAIIRLIEFGRPLAARLPVPANYLGARYIAAPSSTPAVEGAPPPPATSTH